MTAEAPQNCSKLAADTTIIYSFIVPVYNEAGNLSPLMDEICLAANKLKRPWEVVWIDDGSTDGTEEELRVLALLNSQVRVLRSERRAGQSAALGAGLDIAKGNIVITLDGDGQNDPNDVPRLVNALFGADMVVGHRLSRAEGLKRRIFSWCANRVRCLLTQSAIPDSGCGLKVFRSSVGPFFRVDGMHRFIVTYAEINGAVVRSLPVQHRCRFFGRSKYSVRGRLLRPLLDCLALAWLRTRRSPPPHYGPQVSAQGEFIQHLLSKCGNVLTADAKVHCDET